MRRSDREITDRNAIKAFIESEQILRIAYYDAGDIYCSCKLWFFVYG